jgi:hypothetical protein
LHYFKYATIDEFFCKGLRYVSIKVAQGDLQFGQIDFVNKSWPNDLRISYKSPFSLADLEELEEFEGAFEKNEVMEF